MNDASSPPAHSAIKVLAALAELGEASAAAVAEHAGLGYSTTTPKLRAWETSGQAERVRTDDGHTLWRLTPAGRAATAAPAGTAGDRPHPESGPIDLDDQRDRDGEPGPADGPTPAAPGAGPVTPAGDLPVDPITATEVIPAGAADGAVSGTPDPETAATMDAAAGKPDGGEDTPRGATADTDEIGDAAAPEDATPTQAGAEPGSADDAGACADADGADAAGATSRRTAGSLRGAILDILRDHPGQPYKISELCRLIDAANTGTDAKKASAGAVHNAATKLVQTGAAVLAIEKPATFMLVDSPA